MPQQPSDYEQPTGDSPDGREIVRVIRVLEYVGPRRWVEHQLKMASVQGTKVLPQGEIRSAIIGYAPDIFAKGEAGVWLLQHAANLEEDDKH